MMENSPCLYISVYKDDDDEYAGGGHEEEEGEMEGSDEEEVTVETDTRQSSSPEPCENQDSDSHWDSFPCQHCESCFTSQRDLQRHVLNHNLPRPDADAYENDDSPPAPTLEPQDPDADPTGAESAPILPKENCRRPEAQLRRGQDQEAAGGHACDYCEKVFNTRTNKRRHERRIHRRNLAVELAGVTSPSDPSPGGASPRHGPEPTQRYMLDISSNSSENLSLYMDGKIVSTSTMSTCEGGAGSTPGSLLLDPEQISQALGSEAAAGRATPCPSPARRRTATPPLLPQIKTELESEVLVTSSGSPRVPSLIQNLLPRSKRSAAHRERTIFLSPKLKRLLDEQDGLKPTLALLTDGQKFSSPLSVSVVPAGSMRHRRRTVSPAKPPREPSSRAAVDEKIPEAGDTEPMDTAPTEARHVSPPRAFDGKDDTKTTTTTTPPTAVVVEETEASCVAEEHWPQRSGGNPCNQQPLDLSSAVKRGEEDALAEAALDLSLQKQVPDDTQSAATSVPLLKKRKPNSSLLEKAMLNQYSKDSDTEQQNLTLGTPEAPVVTNLTIVTGSRPGEPLSESLVYGLTLPPVSLNPSHASLLPVALQPSSACTIALPSAALHAVLPAAPNLITVLASAASITGPSSRALQVLAPSVAPEPLVVCREDPSNPPGCGFSSAFANAAGLLALSQPFDPTLNLPAHVLLADPIALGTSVGDPAGGSLAPFQPAVTLADSLLGSYNIRSNTVLIECTIALEAPGNMVPGAVALLQGTGAEPPAAPRLTTNQVLAQQPVVSLPSPQTIDEDTVVSPSTELVTESVSSAVAPPGSPTAGASNPEPEPAPMEDEQQTLEEELEEEACVDQTAVDAPQAQTPPPTEPAEAGESTAGPPGETASPEQQQQTFTKNFVCNVCETLFHSMKELGDHVGDHAKEWPYKCEFCVLLFDTPPALLEHRLSLHGVGATYVCSVCSKEFVYLSNLKHHQEELHPGRQCSHTEEQKGKLRPQNHNTVAPPPPPPPPSAAEDSKKPVKKEEEEGGASAEEALTKAPTAASDDAENKGPDVRLGINQHYPSFKPPPFPYHNRSPAGSMASATNFTTHNIPQSFSTAIRCTKCGKSFDNLPELHKHILACANASDKRRYTPKKNPIPLRHFAKAQSGVLSTTNASNGLNAPHHRSKSQNQHQDPPVKIKLAALGKRKKRLAQRAAVAQRSKSPPVEQEVFACPHCSREFTMRRSRTKHAAVCPKKPKEVLKRKEAGVSLTKENYSLLLRGGAADQTPPDDQKVRGTGRVYVSASATPPTAATAAAKRPAVLPVQAVLSHKRSKIIITESVRPQSQEESALGDLPVARTFNPAMRQYGRAQPGAKGGAKAPIKVTLVRPQAVPEEPSSLLRNHGGGEQPAAAPSNEGTGTTGTEQQSPAV